MSPSTTIACGGAVAARDCAFWNPASSWTAFRACPVDRSFGETVPDSHTIGICLTIPEVNLSEPVVTFAGYAALTTAQTTIGGTTLVPGPLHAYELRPVAGTASAVQS
jgi:hypothetical protein